VINQSNEVKFTLLLQRHKSATSFSDIE